MGILPCWRINFLPTLYRQTCAIYLILLCIISVWIYFIKSEWKIFKDFNYKLYISVTLIFFSLINIYIIKKGVETIQEIKTRKINIMAWERQALTFSSLEKWIKQNTSTEDSVLVMPEGIMLNYTTGRNTKLMYYHLIPNHIKALGENNIVKGLTSDKPDYIIITNANYGMYGQKYMCKDFGLQICNFVYKNYDLKTILPRYNENKTKYMTAKIYKLKK